MLFQGTNSRFLSILMQVLIWLVFAFSFLLYQPTEITLPYQLWIKQLLFAGMVAGAYYINAGILVPKFLLHNRVAAYFGLIIVIIVVILFLDDLADRDLGLHKLMEQAFHRAGPPKKHGHGNFDEILGSIIIALILGISTSVTAIQKWQADKQYNQLLREEKTSSELAFLKAQINPHFFFNTLNNIYALTYEDAETSRKAILQLSRMMRYLLYDTKQPFTQLSDEINFLKGYVELMRLRLTQNVVMDFQYPEIVPNVLVAPMLFLPFIENAFKHGISVNEPSEIVIQISHADNLLKLHVKNHVVQFQKNAVTEEYGGIGLENTRRRLELLYPDKYELNVKELSATKEYIVDLSIDLS
jgi:two-component system LytT family sensor kinase